LKLSLLARSIGTACATAFPFKMHNRLLHRIAFGDR
jgi:hypothetical protein